ncbi:Hypothetical protein A7982_04214 [Minicystis rosea]|nr:Hypothetical protein A7982_04214 [Minicystis rosea]
MTIAEAGPPPCRRSRPLRSSVALLALLSFTSTACTTVYRVPTPELAKLNGFHDARSSIVRRLDPRPAPLGYHLVDESGRTHVFDASSRLILDVRTPTGRTEIESRYRWITLDPELFVGLSRDTSREIRVPLAQIQHAGLRKFSSGKTTGLVIGIVLTSLLVAVIVGAALPSTHSGGSHHDWD